MSAIEVPAQPVDATRALNLSAGVSSASSIGQATVEVIMMAANQAYSKFAIGPKLFAETADHGRLHGSIGIASGPRPGHATISDATQWHHAHHGPRCGKSSCRYRYQPGKCSVQCLGHGVLLALTPLPSFYC